MPEPPSRENTDGLEPGDQNTLRTLTRSPHPYHHQSFELPHLSDRFVLRTTPAESKPQRSDGPTSQTTYPSYSKDSSQTSDSGTEADDEHFLKGLPAPRAKLHKGLRGQELLSGTNSPLQSPALTDLDSSRNLGKVSAPKESPEPRRIIHTLRKHKIRVRRVVEAALVGSLGYMVWTNRQVSPLVAFWSRDFRRLGLLFGSLLALYPFSVVSWVYRNKNRSIWKSIKVPTSFDPAPLLYPPAITLCVALLVSINNPAVILPNIVLSICSIPHELVPQLVSSASFDLLHWTLSCLPLTWPAAQLGPAGFTPTSPFVTNETLALLFPLHQCLCLVLHHLTTTSLLTAELQLLSVALINALILGSSPQIHFLTTLIWGGGLAIIIFCGPVIRWGITLARVPRWRFQKAPPTKASQAWSMLVKALSWRRLKHEVLGSIGEDNFFEFSCSSGDEDVSLASKGFSRVRTFGPSFQLPTPSDTVSPPPQIEQAIQPVARRHTLPFLDRSAKRNSPFTPSGRRKRAVSISVRPFLRLTYNQAVLRKWAFALYVYASILLIIFAGVRTYLHKVVFNGNEPLGWALGYFFGNIPWFRFQVVMASLDRWVCLPPRQDAGDEKCCQMGWVEQIRHDDFGEANTRLFLSAYWAVIIICGLGVVFRLKSIVEVDTRRKVFHFMMVGMLLPATYVDPTFAALALSVILIVFLVLDLLRASQLPPLSKPIASFLAPYVDGRDFRGPVVISHIFLLIGCAIPLWLTLASLPRTGDGYAAGWEVPTREVSMVSGVICVGLGDAAASLIGRRFGHRKWLWGGGKSIEGSLAFVAAVFAGLLAASAWLRIGGWPVEGGQVDIMTGTRNAGICASMASLTEAVLTGGNDNVIVPVVLWTCVKSLGV